MARRPDFDPNRPLVAARGFIFAGVNYDAGDPFPDPAGPGRGTFPLRLIKRQYEALAVNHPAEGSPEDNPIRMTGPAGGRYKITAPWLKEPLTIRGKVNAEKALEELTEEGPPIDWVEGGSEVKVEQLGGGWFQFTAPWLDEPEKVQGREPARALFLKLHHSPGPPQIDLVPYPASTVLVSVVDDGFEVTAPWLDATETYDDADAAAARQAELRADGPPEDWFDVVAAVQVNAEGEAFEVIAPWLDEPESFDNEDDAHERRDVLIAEGPPNDWDPAASPADAGTSDDDATAKS